MAHTAHVFSENGEKLIRLPEGVEPAASEFDVHHDEHSGQITLLPHRPKDQKSLDDFFKLRDEIGPIEEDFMAYRDRERQIFGKVAQQAAKPDTLDRFFEIQRQTGPGEEDFLADRDAWPSPPREVF